MPIHFPEWGEQEVNRVRAPPAIDEVRTLPLSPPNVNSKSEFAVFVHIIQPMPSSAMKFVHVKTSGGKIVAKSLSHVS